MVIRREFLTKIYKEMTRTHITLRGLADNAPNEQKEVIHRQATQLIGEIVSAVNVVLPQSYEEDSSPEEFQNLLRGLCRPSLSK
jgi:hypothetical protein